MGKRLPAAAAAVAAAARTYARGLRSAAAGKAAKAPPAPLDTPRNAAAAAGAAASSGRAEVRDLAAACGLEEDERVPLSEVVSDCTRRWFQDALKEARTGDAAMQVLVGQMYRSGYGVNKNEHKRQKFGWRKHQGIVLLSGKLATNAQGTMLVTQIQMMLRKHVNDGSFRAINGWDDSCACTAAVTTKPVKQHKLPLEASDIQF
ncbi:hypothetical protein ACP4OV_005171 [Aristida adscensionis]